MTSQIPTIPLEDFFRNPSKSTFLISPDGLHIGYMKPWKSRMNIFVLNTQSQQERRLTACEDRSIYGFVWLNNHRIGYAKDEGGDENVHYYAVNIDGSNEIDLTPFDNIQARMIDHLPDDPDHIIVGLNQRNPQIHDPYRVNIHSGERTLLAENPGNIASWVTDHNGILRAATTTDGVNTSLLYRDSEGDDFRVLLTTNFKISVSPLFFTFDNQQLYVASNRLRDKAAIYRFNVESATEEELIFSHEEVDVSALLYSKKRKVLTGVAFVRAKQEIIFFDEWRQRVQDNLEAQLAGYQVSLTSLSKDETKAVVLASSDRARGTYYFYDIEQNTLIKLASLSPWLNEQNMAQMKPIQYKSRDGLTINGYLTLPVGVEAKNLPVVVNPHGGPWARDVWGYKSEIQFLANRGFAVFQMNFRGSTGYGREFIEKSFKQWGKTMQDDISDGVQWLIDEGIADPKRIAIYGASYGGYATLAGLTFTPDLYACGVDYVGVSSLFTFMDSMPPYWEMFRSMMHEMVGHPEDDKEHLASASPLLHVDKIKVPLFIAQGANDPRVKKSESDQIVAALKARGIEVPYMVKEDEGHGFYNEENQFEFYREMETFLQRHIGTSL
ncbi:MAG: S9 family peptidase [Myxococcota bacterium]|nr:S9 family peptidase [Myxococcota bacterium]